MKQLRAFWQNLQTQFARPRVRQLAYLGFGLGGLVFIALAAARNWNEFRHLHFDLRFVGLALLIYPLGMLPTVLGWHWLLRALGVRLPWVTNLRYYSLSALPRHIPGFVLFAASRSLLYQEVGISPAWTLAATGGEIGLLAATGFLLALPLLVTQPTLAARLGGWSSAAILFLGLALLAALLLPRLRRWRAKMQALAPTHGPFDGRALGLALLWMLAAWVGGGLILYTLGCALLPLTWAQLPGFIAAWGAAGAVSLTIGIGIAGFGIREVTLGAVLALMMPVVQAATLTIAFRLALTVGEALWVGVFVWLTRHAASPLDEAAPPPPRN